MEQKRYPNCSARDRIRSGRRRFRRRQHPVGGRRDAGWRRQSRRRQHVRTSGREGSGIACTRRARVDLVEHWVWFMGPFFPKREFVGWVILLDNTRSSKSKANSKERGTGYGVDPKCWYFLVQISRLFTCGFNNVWQRR